MFCDRLSLKECVKVFSLSFNEGVEHAWSSVASWGFWYLSKCSSLLLLQQRKKNTSELQVPIVIGVYLAKLQFVPKAILTIYVWEIFKCWISFVVFQFVMLSCVLCRLLITLLLSCEVWAFLSVSYGDVHTHYSEYRNSIKKRSPISKSALLLFASYK